MTPVRGVLIGFIVLGVLTLAPAASATPAKYSNNGVSDFNFGSSVQSAGGAATGQKPESKLFYTNDLTWWAVLGNSSPSGVYLWELVNHAWVRQSLQFTNDATQKADTLFDGSTLFVALRDNSSPMQSSLYEVPYNGGGNWGSVSGPFPITTENIETLTIAKDSLNRLWVTFEDDTILKPQVGYTAPGGTSFTIVTLSTSNPKPDDISDITSFGGNKIGVFWSDQNAKKDFFWWRNDSDPVGTLPNHETAYGGGVGSCPTATSARCADDHMNIKTTSDGTLYVSVKTSLGDSGGCSGGVCASTDPLIALLRRTPTGTWSAYKVAQVIQDGKTGTTRPNVAIEPDANLMWVFAQWSGHIEFWESSLSSPAFTPGAHSVWVSSSSNDPSTTKQIVSGASGTVVEASGGTTYYHNEFLPSGPSDQPPTADNVGPLTTNRNTQIPTVTLTGHDAEDCELTFNVPAMSANGGTISAPSAHACTPGSSNSDTATVSYAPANNFTGTDTFTYTVTDTKGTSNPATVTIKVNAPPAAAAKSVTIVENSVNKAITLSGTDDLTCDLTFTTDATTAQNVTLGSVVNAPCTGSGPFADTGTVSYTPPANYVGPDSFTYKTTDGGGLDSGSATVSITVAANSSPTADNVGPLTTNKNTQIPAITLTGHDAEDCELTFNVPATSANGGAIGPVANKACSGAGPFTDTASVSYTPANNFTGSDSFTYTVTDSKAGTSPSATVSITVSSGISLRSSSSGVNTETTSLVLPTPPGVQAGDVMLAQVDVRCKNATMSTCPTVTAPVGWNLIRTDSNAGIMMAQAYWRPATSSEPANYTWTFDLSMAASGGIAAYTGVNTSTPVDTSSALISNTNITTITAPSVNTAVNGEMLVGLYECALLNNLVTPPPGMTEHWDLGNSVGSNFINSEMADVVQATLGPTGDKVATASAAKNIGQLVALKPA